MKRNDSKDDVRKPEEPKDTTLFQKSCKILRELTDQEWEGRSYQEGEYPLEIVSSNLFSEPGPIIDAYFSNLPMPRSVRVVKSNSQPKLFHLMYSTRSFADAVKISDFAKFILELCSSQIEADLERFSWLKLTLNFTQEKSDERAFFGSRAEYPLCIKKNFIECLRVMLAGRLFNLFFSSLDSAVDVDNIEWGNPWCLRNERVYFQLMSQIKRSFKYGSIKSQIDELDDKWFKCGIKLDCIVNFMGYKYLVDRHRLASNESINLLINYKRLIEKCLPSVNATLNFLESQYDAFIAPMLDFVIANGVDGFKKEIKRQACIYAGSKWQSFYYTQAIAQANNSYLPDELRLPIALLSIPISKCSWSLLVAKLMQVNKYKMHFQSLFNKNQPSELADDNDRRRYKECRLSYKH